MRPNDTGRKPEFRILCLGNHKHMCVCVCEHWTQSSIYIKTHCPNAFYVRPAVPWLKTCFHVAGTGWTQVASLGYIDSFLLASYLNYLVYAYISHLIFNLRNLFHQKVEITAGLPYRLRAVENNQAFGWCCNSNRNFWSVGQGLTCSSASESELPWHRRTLSKSSGM